MNTKNNTITSSIALNAVDGNPRTVGVAVVFATLARSMNGRINATTKIIPTAICIALSCNPIQSLFVFYQAKYEYDHDYQNYRNPCGRW